MFLIQYRGCVVGIDCISYKYSYKTRHFALEAVSQKCYPTDWKTVFMEVLEQSSPTIVNCLKNRSKISLNFPFKWVYFYIENTKVALSLWHRWGEKYLFNAHILYDGFVWICHNSHKKTLITKGCIKVSKNIKNKLFSTKENRDQ